MKQHIVIVILTVFIELSISTIIIVQQSPNQQGPPPIPVPEIRYFPKEGGNSTDPSNNSTTPTPAAPPPEQKPNPPPQPNYPNYYPMRPPFGGGGMPYPPQFYNQNPNIQWVPIGRLMFGG